MICLDTTVLIDLWRSGGREDAPVVVCLRRCVADEAFIPSLVAGEFIEGGAVVGVERYRQSIQFPERFRVASIGRETAVRYAEITAALRDAGALKNLSKIDLWIAASALEHGAQLVTRNLRDFQSIPTLVVVEY